ncbi:MAG: hypothetical protein WA057_04035, partial [Candidatus Magasanikiibacteriota bacterium]
DETPSEVISLKELLPKHNEVKEERQTKDNNFDGEKIDVVLSANNQNVNKPNNFGQNNNGLNQPSRNKKRKKKKTLISQINKDFTDGKSRQTNGVTINNQTANNFNSHHKIIEPPQKIKPDQVVKFEDNPIVKQPPNADNNKKTDDPWDDDYRKDK